MRRKLLLTLAVVLVLSSVMGLASCTPYHLRPKPSINTENTLEDQYVVKEVGITTARYGAEPVMKPTVSGFRNASRQKTLNARLKISNEIIAINPDSDKNEQAYQTYKIWQQNQYLFSCQYITAFETTISNIGINLIIGSEIDGTLVNNLPSLLGTDLDSEGWESFMILFDEARELAEAKPIEKEYMRTDNVSFVFIGDDYTDMTLLIMYKVKGDTEQQEVEMELNDLYLCFSEKIQVYLSFTTDPNMTYEEYATNINEYRLFLASE